MAANTLTLSAWTARRLPDENVFDRTLRGDPVAFSEVYRRYQKRIYGYCLARSLDPDTAADATQEVFMKLLRAEPGSIDNPQAWLFAVARNVVIDAARKRTRTPEDAGLDEESQAWDRLKSADTADEVLSRSDARNVFLALRTLRPRYRTALVMREIHGQTAKDMAEALETTPGAIDTLVSRARDAFGVAYAAVGDLPSTCRANVELIYRKLGTGITDAEQAALQAHLAECERCRAEAKRADNPHHLAALLPFLVPAKGFAHGLLERAALSARMFPDVVAQQGASVLTQPHTWNLATKIAAGIAAAAIVTAPIAVTRMHHAAPPAVRSAAAETSPSSSDVQRAGSGMSRTLIGGGARPAGSAGSSGTWSRIAGSGTTGSTGSWTRAGWSGDMMRGSGSDTPTAAATKMATSASGSSSSSSGSGAMTGSTSTGTSTGSGMGSVPSGGSGGSGSMTGGSWSSGGSGSAMGSGMGGW